MSESYLLFQRSHWVPLENDQRRLAGLEAAKAAGRCLPVPRTPLQLDRGTLEGRKPALLRAQRVVRLRKHALSELVTSRLLHQRRFGS